MSPGPQVRLEIVGSNGVQRTLELHTRFTARPIVTDFLSLIREYESQDRMTVDYVYFGGGVTLMRLPTFDTRFEIDRAMGRSAIPIPWSWTCWQWWRLVEGVIRLADHVFDRPVVDTVRNGGRPG